MPRRGQPNGPDYVQVRPEKDSVPLIDCGHAWCGREVHSASLEATMVAVLIDDGAREFCSAGCASRWLIRYELRANPPATVTMIDRPRPSTRGRSESHLIREWAREHGIPVAAKGYLSPGLVQRYREANP